MESEKVLILLNGENYSRWKFKIAAVLEAKDRHDVVTGEATCPQKDESEIKAWKKRGALGRSIILRSLDDFAHAFIRSCKTSREMMNCLVRIKEQATVSSKLLVSSEFHAYKWKPGMNVTLFIAGLNAIVSKMQSLQIELDEEIVIGKVIQCLPSDCDSFRQSWRLSAPKTVTLSHLTSQLRASVLEAKDRHDVVTGEATCPQKDESEIKAWKKRGALARSIILIKEQATVNSKLLVSSEFHAYKWKPGMNVTLFIAGLNAIVSKMQSLQIELDEEIVIGKVIQCLPSDCDSFRQSWRLSAPKTVTLSHLTSQLRACESDQLCRSIHRRSLSWKENKLKRTQLEF
ncbi:hypothetical protein T4D_3219 [Trichinella pseudospiralis]|uniref:DUF4219 domain-containing protein n=1 Tax=Trichinella pseudospiralis TaxID=6337 RepID=A0A0V1F6P9_TRIPS|nr:hypothetical protein T4D_3219 [Trichinella pseudospiralis]